MVLQGIANMFEEKQGIQYLGVYGNEGSGKSTLCGEAMCSYFQKEFQGRICRVELDFDADSNRAAAKKREARIRHAIQQLVGLDRMMAAISSEKQVMCTAKSIVHNQVWKFPTSTDSQFLFLT